MIRKMHVLALVVCMSSYPVFAGTGGSIGTASTRGEMQVDSYAVRGSATLFNGTVVQTGQTAAEFHLAKGVNVMLSTESSGTLFADHMVLNRGVARFASGSYQLQTLGLHVTPVGPNATGVVAVLNGNSVEVSSVTGEIAVSGPDGAPLANLGPGETHVFSAIQPSDSQDQNNGGKKNKGGNGWTMSDKAVAYTIIFETGAALGVGIGLGVGAASR